MVKALNYDEDATLGVDCDPGTELDAAPSDAALLDMAAGRLNGKEQSAVDAQNERRADAGEWREFVLRRLLRELGDGRKVGQGGDRAKALANTGKSLARRIILCWLRRALTLGG